MQNQAASCDVMSLADGARRREAETWARLDKAHRSRSLAISPPPDCLKALADRLAAFNDDVANYHRRRSALADSLASVAGLLESPDTTADDVRQAAAEAAAERFAVRQEARRLLEARQVLLGEVLTALEARQVEIEEALSKATAKAEKDLRKAGMGPDEKVAAVNPTAAVNHFAALVRQAAPVRAEAERVTTCKAHVEQARQALADLDNAMQAAAVAAVEAGKALALGILG